MWANGIEIKPVPMKNTAKNIPQKAVAPIVYAAKDKEVVILSTPLVCYVFSIGLSSSRSKKILVKSGVAPSGILYELLSIGMSEYLRVTKRGK